MIEASKRKIAFALLQEPYVGRIKRMKNYRGVRIFQNTKAGEGTVKAAIAIFDQQLDVLQYPELTTNNIVVVGIRTRAWEIALVSFYLEKDLPIEPYLEQIKNIKQKVKPTKILFSGDANAKSAWWGSPTQDHRGEDMAGALEELELQILNRGSTPTYEDVRGGRTYTSFIDVTACTLGLLDLVEDWRVSQDLTGSDHNGILFQINLEKSKGISIERTTRKYNTKKANWVQFREKLAHLNTENQLIKSEIEKINNKQELEKIIDKYITNITCISETTIPRRKTKEKIGFPWWSEELTVLKKAVATRKRRIGCAALIRRQGVIREYLEFKERYETQARKAATESWMDFCNRQDREGVWEGIYRIIGRTAKRQEDIPLEKNGKVLSPKESVALLAETFYPGDPEDDDSENHRNIREQAKSVNDASQDETCDPQFTMLELKTSVESFNPKKAPGEDGLTADICREAILSNPASFLALTNKCLELSHFPVRWKRATVVVLRKPGKDDYTNAKSYRPIGLLPVLGKILEKMMVARIKWHLIPRLSTRQYGFMPQRSTEDSLYNLVQHIQQKIKMKKIVTVISLDIEGAFDSAWWPAVRVRLAEENCPVNIRRLLDSYLQDREVAVRYAGEQHTRKTEKGCVQGSIGGPILWNLLLDPLLQELERNGEHCQAFADDVVLVFDGNSGSEIQERANGVLARVREWGIKNKLRFAPHKTCAMVLTKKLKYDAPRLVMGGVHIGMSKEIKILGLTIDEKLTFNAHIANICRKALDVYKQLSRAAKASWGLSPEVIRAIYTAAVEPIITYAASVWAPAANKISTQKHLNAVQRGFAQKMCKSYRTVSLNSALVLTGILPLDLRIQEAAALYEARRGLSQLLPEDREMELMATPTEAPHPAEQVDMEFMNLRTETEVQNQNQQELRIFTDGSKIEGRVGAALSLWSGGAEIATVKLSLSAYCTVYQAELLAICRATEEAVRRKERTFGVYSDSRAALETLKNNNAIHPLAVEARKNLKVAFAQGKGVSLFWVKAHEGLMGNERADQLAKDAALKMKTRPNYDRCPISYVKREIRTGSIREWSRRYASGETAAVTKMFLPDAREAFKIVKDIKPTGIITQVLTGHGGFSEYLNRFKCKEDPSCICEPEMMESVPHLLLDCPVFDRLRLDVSFRIDAAITAENICVIMTDKNKRGEFLRFCEEVARKVIKRNK